MASASTLLTLRVVTTKKIISGRRTTAAARNTELALPRGVGLVSSGGSPRWERVTDESSPDSVPHE